MKFRERMQRFMYGRYGVDALGKFLLGVSMVFLILSWFLPTAIPYILAVLCLVYSYFRMFSRNVQKRYLENCTYTRYINMIKGFFQKQKSYMTIRKTHHIFKCPNCKQKIRIPKGKGKVAIRCSKCGTEFVKVSR